MPQTVIEKILGSRAGRPVRPGENVDIFIDVRAARDFGGANVVKSLSEHGLGLADPGRTCFTFDCNPGGSDQKYAANQHECRKFARQSGVRIYDVDRGIGTHLVIDEGLVGPGDTFVSTDSHANLLGAVGAFGQGMGDQDIAGAFARGKVWFKVPPSMKVKVTGTPSPRATPKDLALALLRNFGADGMLGYAVEVEGPAIEALDLAGRITVASLATEMGAIILFFPPSPAVQNALPGKRPLPWSDPGATFARTETVDVAGLEPMIARPGHPEDALPVAEVKGIKIDSVFIGSCTNGRHEDLVAAAAILKNRKVAPGVVLKVVPATDEIWKRCLADGVVKIFKDAGALFGNAGCAGCAAGQLGQNGPGEVTVSTGNRNFVGKQGQGQVYLASPATAVASAVAGVITTAAEIPASPALFTGGGGKTAEKTKPPAPETTKPPLSARGRAWVVDQDNVDTDMIFHNRHLASTDQTEMGRHAFGNLKGHEAFAREARPGDIVIGGRNFGCGSSRQQAVDCFKSLKISALVAESFGAIYERNAINAAFPVLEGKLRSDGVKNGDDLEIDFLSGRVVNHTRKREHTVSGFSEVQKEIYERGGLLAG